MIRGFLLGITGGVCALAQTPTSHFEVASIKPVSTDVPMRASADPDRLILSRVGMIDLLMQALYVDRDQVAAPEWINAETYEITANRPPGSTKEHSAR